MATKFSAITAAGAITGTDNVLGIQAGPTDVLYTITNLSTYFKSVGAGGSTTQIQYNNAGALGGISSWTTNGTTALTGAASTTIAIGGATIGTNALAATGSVVFNANSTAPPTAITGTALQVVGADSVIGRVQVNSFGAIAAVSTTRANGTGAVPTAVLSGDQIGGLNAYSYVTSAAPGYVGPIASVQTYATQNHTTTAMGSKFILATIPNGSTTLTTALTVDQDQSVAMAGRATAATSFAIGGATIGTNALAVTGTTLLGGNINTAGNSITGIGNVISSGAAAYQLSNLSATATVPTVIPNRGDLNSGVGGAAGTLSMIAASLERVRIATNAASVSDVLLPGTLFTGGTATTTFPQILVQPTGTAAVTSWSTSGTIFGANVVSGFAGNFLDFHTAGSASMFSVNSAGTITSTSSVGLLLTNNSGRVVLGNASDLIIGWKAAASLQFGNADAATAVAQTTRVQSVIAGTADTAGANWTHIGSLSTGSGVSGDMIFQTGGTGAGSTVQNAAVTSLTIKGATQTVQIAVGKALAFVSGTNQRAGNATLVGGTVTVSNTTVTANTVVMLTRKTSGGTIGTAITYTLSAGVSFTITSDNILDTSVFSYILIEVP